jgi:beta-lactamase superfamily II metal-dependent hydrolase
MAKRKPARRKIKVMPQRRRSTRPPRAPRGNERTDNRVGSIRVRMYRVGFGDCFLISLPVPNSSGGAATDRYVLVDCGVHAKGDIGSIDKVVQDIASTTNRKLAILIATHAHQDHISGFDRFGGEFAKFEIGEVWLPWTWDPSNAEAVKLKQKHAALAEAVVAHLAATTAADRAVGEAAANAALNAHGNAHGISLLKSGFGVGAKVRYLKAGDTLADPAGIAGLAVRVLGPPQSQEFLAQMDPPAGQHYLRLGADQNKNTKKVEPFGRQWRVSQRNLGHLAAKLSRADETEFQDMIGSPAEDLAFALDKVLNNESVVTLLTYRGQHLLLPGDAQYGNWRWWLENEQPDEILRNVNFFKVAHHGSVNATPKDALEKMSDGQFAAMVSTQSTPWPSIPRVPLMERLDEKTKSRIVRSDWIEIKGAPAPSPKTAPPKPAALPSGFSQGDLWFDYVM